MLFDSEAKEKEAKQKFAKLFAKNPTFQNANEIAFQIFNDDADIWKAVKIATDWPEDAEILNLAVEASTRHVDDDDSLRAKMVNTLVGLFENSSLEAKDRVAAIKELAELQGLKIKPTVEGLGEGVGYVYFPVTQNIDEWEKESMAHQGDLINKVFK